MIKFLSQCLNNLISFSNTNQGIFMISEIVFMAIILVVLVIIDRRKPKYYSGYISDVKINGMTPEEWSKVPLHDRDRIAQEYYHKCNKNFTPLTGRFPDPIIDTINPTGGFVRLKDFKWSKNFTPPNKKS